MQGPDGRLVYANDAAARLCGLELRRGDGPALAGTEFLRRFEIIGEDGAPVPLEQLPNRRAYADRARRGSGIVGYRDPRDGEQRWSRLRATPIFNDGG